MRPPQKRGGVRPDSRNSSLLRKVCFLIMASYAHPRNHLPLSCLKALPLDCERPPGHGWGREHKWARWDRCSVPGTANIWFPFAIAGKDSTAHRTCQQGRRKNAVRAPYSHTKSPSREAFTQVSLFSGFLCAFVALCEPHFRHSGLWIGPYDNVSRYSIRKNKMTPHTLTSVSNFSRVTLRHILLAAHTASGRQASATPIPARTSLR
jgi:hypothetical protein